MSASARNEVWIWDLARGTQTLFTTGESSSAAPAGPVWSQDNTRLAFAADGADLYERPVNALEDARRLLRGTPGDQIRPTSWSTDGQFILLDRQNPQTGGDIPNPAGGRFNAGWNRWS
jgi:Tol biopolymer transport system component